MCKARHNAGPSSPSPVAWPVSKEQEIAAPYEVLNVASVPLLVPLELVAEMR
jgi:hypothetical protein